MHPEHCPQAIHPLLAFRSQSGVALVIILAFIVLLTGLVVAFFSRSISERQVSNSSASQTKAEVFAQGAADQIIGDLKQEIVAGSTLTIPVSGVNLYIPKDTLTGALSAITPADQGFTRTYDAATKLENDGLNNLIKRSAYNGKFYDKSKNTNYSADGVSRAANVSTTVASQNGRFVSPARWNKPYLLPATSATTANAPDWILVGRDGTNPAAPTPATTAANYVVGRYAYNIYDEGGILDINAAGNPLDTTANPLSKIAPQKSTLAYADLNQIPGIASLSATDRAQVINALVGWRNFVTAGTTGTFPAYTGFATAQAPASLAPFDLATLANSKGYLSPNNEALSADKQTDRMVTTRQQLIGLLNSIGKTTGSFTPALQQQTLQYLTAFSRSLNQPSYVPALIKDPNAPKILQDGSTLFGGNNAFGGDTTINPSFLATRVATGFTRNDGTSAVPGEPLVIERFALSRLCWLTYLGPSAINLGNPVVTAMKSQGVPKSLLEQGTASNIYRYFGLTWDSPNYRWVYDHNSVTPPAGVPTPAKAGATSANIFTLSAITGREPDFFELLKAGINVGSLGKHGSLGIIQNENASRLTQGTKVQYLRDIQVDMQYLTIGLNIIDQSDPDNYPTRLLVWNPLSTAPATRELSGVENLPYIHRVRSGVVRLVEASTAATSKPMDAADNLNVNKTGAAALLMYPELWNPHAANSPANGVDPQTGVAFVGMTPTKFQVILNTVDPDHYGVELSIELSQYFAKYDSRFNYTELAYPIITPQGPLPGGGRKSAIQFDISAGNNTLFREPTLLVRANTPAGTNLRAADWPPEVTMLPNYVAGVGLTSSIALGDLIANDAPAAANQKYSAGSLPNDRGPFVGLFLGRAPLQVWSNAAATTYDSVSSLQANYVVARPSNPDGTVFGDSFSIRLQYEYPPASGNYVTYNEVDPPIVNGNVSVQYLCQPENLVNLVDSFDPRTARFGMLLSSQGNPYAFIGATGISETNRSRANDAGRGFKNDVFGTGFPAAPAGITWSNPNPSSLTDYHNTAQPAPGWFGANDGWSSGIPLAVPTLIEQNDPSLTQFGNMFYADVDGVIRRGMGAYMPTGTTDPGNPMKIGDNQSRPIILNRPFRSVAELGHVFRDTPWKNLDFFTPESGDAALLDVFCVNDTDNADQLAAGKVNLNTRQQPVLKAILAGAFKDELNNFPVPVSTGSLAPVAATEADKIATVLTTTSLATPLQNVADLIGSWGGTKKNFSNIATFPDQTGKGYGIDGKMSYVGFTKNITSAAYDSSTNPTWYIQRMHESATRALSSVGQTRVWNLLIDVVAQTGRYPVSAATLDKFTVEGEQRYWIHLAIDRYTAKILEKQVEIVKE